MGDAVPSGPSPDLTGPSPESTGPSPDVTASVVVVFGVVGENFVVVVLVVGLKVVVALVDVSNAVTVEGSAVVVTTAGVHAGFLPKHWLSGRMWAVVQSDRASGLQHRVMMVTGAAQLVSQFSAL